jgi:hemoglobin
MHPDIHNEQDIKVIVDSFYRKIQSDSLLSVHFLDVDWDKHLPKMYDFWHSIVFLTGRYKGYPFAAHLSLKSPQKRDFQKWLELFCHTVDENFKGENAETIKNKANQIATVFMLRLGIYEN